MKYEFKGTKGDWKTGDIYPSGAYGENKWIKLNNGQLVCSVINGGNEEEAIANAKLIAAAPEMLKALEYAELGLKAHGNKEINVSNILLDVQSAIKKALDFSAVDSSDNSSPDQVASPGPRVQFKGKGLIGMFLYKHDNGQEYVGMVAGKDLPIVWSIEPNWKDFDEQLDTEQLIRTAWTWENFNEYQRTAFKSAFPEVYKDFTI